MFADSRQMTTCARRMSLLLTAALLLTSVLLLPAALFLTAPLLLRFDLCACKSAQHRPVRETTRRIGMSRRTNEFDMCEYSPRKAGKRGMKMVILRFCRF